MSGDEREASRSTWVSLVRSDPEAAVQRHIELLEERDSATARADDLAREVERIAADLERTLTKYETTNDYIDGCQAVSRDTATRLRAALDGGAAGGGVGE